MQELIFAVISSSTVCFLLISDKINEDECPQEYRLYKCLATNNTHKSRKYQKDEGRVFCYIQEIPLKIIL